MAEIKPIGAPGDVPRLVIVDLDGTLVDSFEQIRRGVACALAEFGIDASPATLDLSRRGLPLEAYYRVEFDRDPDAPAERARFAAFVAAYRHHYGAERDVPTVYPGVTDTLRALTARGLTLAVGTSKRTDMARAIVRNAGLGELFALVQGSENFPKKPDPALLHAIAETLGAEISRAVMVGDTGADIGAARAAGAVSIAVTYGGWGRDELEQLGPAHLIDAFPELLDLV